MIVQKRKAWEICQGVSQRNKRYVSSEKINNCLLKWDFFSHGEYGVNVDFLSCRTVLIICCAMKENQELYLMTSASLCSSNETLRELSLAENGNNNANSWLTSKKTEVSTHKKNLTFKGVGYWELLYNVKSLFSTLFLGQTQIIKCWQYTQLITLT